MEAVQEYLNLEEAWRYYLLASVFLGVVLVFVFAWTTMKNLRVIERVLSILFVVASLMFFFFAFDKAATIREEIPPPAKISICCDEYDDILDKCVKYSNPPEKVPVIAVMKPKRPLSFYEKIKCSIYPILDNSHWVGKPTGVECRVLYFGYVEAVIPAKRLTGNRSFQSYLLVAELSNKNGYKEAVFLKRINIVKELCGNKEE